MKHGFALDWMKNSDAFEQACSSNTSYMANFTQSISLMISEFYNNFPCVGVSSITGEGMDKLFAALEQAAIEYEVGYKVELEQKKAERARQEEKRQRENIEKVKADINKPIFDSTAAKKPVSQTIDTMDIDTIRTAADDEDEEDEDDEAERVDYETFLKILGDDTWNTQWMQLYFGNSRIFY